MTCKDILLRTLQSLVPGTWRLLCRGSTAAALLASVGAVLLLLRTPAAEPCAWSALGNVTGGTTMQLEKGDKAACAEELC